MQDFPTPRLLLHLGKWIERQINRQIGITSPEVSPILCHSPVVPRPLPAPHTWQGDNPPVELFPQQPRFEGRGNCDYGLMIVNANVLIPSCGPVLHFCEAPSD